jgi:NAD(P)-dependent dehydrogenase (short-subunit alcohol dehydrogenase family)
MDLHGRVAIVTGSGGDGSGRAEARRLAREGCSVVVADLSASGGEETVRIIAAEGGAAAFRRCDVGAAAEVAALVAFAEERFGGLDILINNASAPYRPRAPIAEWMETLQVDLLGAIYGLQHASAAMARRGGGVAVNVGSTSALVHGPGHANAPAYDIAKIGVVRLTTAAAGLCAEAGIRINCLVPAWVATPEVKTYWEALTAAERRDRGAPDTLLSLDEIAAAALALVVDDSLTGRILVCWNGRPPALIPIGDPGYAALQTYVPDRP